MSNESNDVARTIGVDPNNGVAGTVGSGPNAAAAAPSPTTVGIPIEGLEKDLGLLIAITHLPTKTILVGAEQEFSKYVELSSEDRGKALVAGVANISIAFKQHIAELAAKAKADVKVVDSRIVDAGGDVIDEAKKEL